MRLICLQLSSILVIIYARVDCQRFKWHKYVYYAFCKDSYWLIWQIRSCLWNQELSGVCACLQIVMQVILFFCRKLKLCTHLHTRNMYIYTFLSFISVILHLASIFVFHINTYNIVNIFQRLNFWGIYTVMSGLHVHFTGSAVERICTLWQASLFRGVIQ